MTLLTDGAVALLPDLSGLATDLLDHIRDAVCVIDREWRMVYANRRACELCGSGRDAVIGIPLWDRFPQLAGGEAERRLRHVVESGGTIEVETALPDHADGLRLRATKLRGGLTCLLWQSAEPLANEAALRASEERLRLAQEGAGVGVWDWDLLTDELYWSPQMYRLLGIDAGTSGSDLLGAWRRAVHPDDRAAARATSERRRVDPTVSEFDFRVLHPDGTIRWMLAKGMAVTCDERGRPVRVAGISIDITERKRAEATLRELTEGLEARVAARTAELADLNERLRRERVLSQLVVESIAEGIIVVDTDLRYLVWNAGMERINGRSRAEVLGRTVFEAFPHEVDGPVGQAWRDALAGRRVELRNRRYFSGARGIEIVYEADFTPLHDEAGTIVGVITIVRDITERQRIEERLQQSQKLEAVAQLTGGVAHDFNNLLTAVIGCVDLIAHQAERGRIRDLAATALRSAERGSRLTQQLLAFSRRQALRPVAADLNALLREIEVLLRRAVGESVEIVVDRASGLGHCEIDPAQFEAAALNLVINARDAMPNGGRITLHTRDVAPHEVPAELELAAGAYIAFAVRDTGAGMPPEVAARAFEPFYTTKEIGKGSGLGLSMVYGFARQSGGGVRLESAPGAGTGVTLYLPRAVAEAAAAEPVAAGEARPSGSGAVLIVEDDDDVRDVSVETLSSLGYEVSVARNGREALAVLRRPGPLDLLFTDIVMPGGLSGVALARRARTIRPGIRVLLTTGYAGLETAGADEFSMILKPFRPAELSRRVAALIDHGEDEGGAIDNAGKCRSTGGVCEPT
ncbi:MAG TPA: PAS domain-containing protein [Stellaceae bacterium]|nr:PAS domain-containing protein [Stellaceae bacterium]